ncbi:hypothetical protein, partial [Bradyrhizobium sp. LeoA1S1]
RNRMLGLLCLDNQKRPICLGFAEHALRHSDSFPGQPCRKRGEVKRSSRLASMRIINTLCIEIFTQTRHALAPCHVQA